MYSQNTGGLAQALADSMAPKFAVSYLRVSTTGQAERGGGDDEGFSIPAQREANKRKALSMGAIVGKEFVERGASARSAARPELKRMLEYVKENKDRVDYVIVHKVDRLARNRGDDVDITRALEGANVQLVSASESIDNTPSGMLLHGIMSSIAEFYSRNLSTEVKKGLTQKAKSGGTPNKAPIGYKNIRDVDEAGRRDSRVEVDEERAALITLAFKEYATGNWALTALAEHVSDLGLETPATRRLPAKSVGKRMLHTILINPYYKGIVRYNGVEHEGRHTPIVDVATWDKVQEILKSKLNGERTRIHEHYLKSTVYCGKCGARLIIHNAKSRSGARYPYFVCAAKHSKRNNCDQRSLLIEEVASQIEALYERISFTPAFRQLLQDWATAQIDKLVDESKAELDRLRKQQEKLERERRKLLQAYYDNAIAPDLLKEEQDRIGKALNNITNQVTAYQAEHDEVAGNLNDVFTLLDDCGTAYRLADDFERRCFNQALFERIRTYEGEDGRSCVGIDTGVSIETDFAEPFATLLDSDIFVLKSVFEKNMRKKKDGQPKSAAHLSFPALLKKCKTKTSSIFYGAGLSMDYQLRSTGLEPARGNPH